MDVVIRSAAEADLEAIHEILTSPHVVAGSMRVPYAPLHQTRERLAPTRGIHQLVAESEGRVVGFGELVTHPDEPRMRHVGEVNMVATHEVRLYERLGFAIEGTMPRMGFGAGDDIEAAVLYPEDARYLVGGESRVTQYQVVDQVNA